MHFLISTRVGCCALLVAFFSAAWPVTSLAVDPAVCSQLGGNRLCIDLPMTPYRYAAGDSEGNGTFPEPSEAAAVEVYRSAYCDPGGGISPTGDWRTSSNPYVARGGLRLPEYYGHQEKASIKLYAAATSCQIHPRNPIEVVRFREPHRECPAAFQLTDHPNFDAVTPAPGEPVYCAADCQNNHVTLTVPFSVEPDATTTINGQVTDCESRGVASVQVTISLSVVARSGFHEHDLSRPRGMLSLTGVNPVQNLNVTADGSGSFSFVFHAPAAAGTHSIQASCIGSFCSSHLANKSIDVKIEGLERIPSSNFYTTFDRQGNEIGVTGRHPDNHHLTSDAVVALERLAFYYHALAVDGMDEFTPIYVNDASLPWGGVFDIASSKNWKPPHAEHRRGTVVDVRANEAEGAIESSDFSHINEAQELADMGSDAASHCGKDSRQGATSQPRRPLCIRYDGTVDPNRHFHIRLLGRGE